MREKRLDMMKPALRFSWICIPLAALGLLAACNEKTTIVYPSNQAAWRAVPSYTLRHPGSNGANAISMMCA